MVIEMHSLIGEELSVDKGELAHSIQLLIYSSRRSPA
jgi:hypothetical protein